VSLSLLLVSPFYTVTNSRIAADGDRGTGGSGLARTDSLVKRFAREGNSVAAVTVEGNGAKKIRWSGTLVELFRETTERKHRGGRA